MKLKDYKELSVLKKSRRIFKTLFLVAVSLVVGTSGVLAQGNETFSHSSSSTSYTTINWTGDNGVAWSATDARGDQVITSGDKAITVRNGAITGALSTAQQTAGIGKISFDYKIPYSDATKDITATITAGSKVVAHNIGKLTVNEVYNTGEIEINSSDASSIEIAISSVAAGARLVIDNLVWTAAVGGGTPTVAAPTFTPASGSYTSSQSVTISSATEGATIYYTLDGSTPDNTTAQYTEPITISATTTLKAIAYKTGMDASYVSTATYTFPTEVATIAALRENSTGLFKLTGEAVLSFATSVRNAKYIQDATGGVLIDDSPGIITTVYNVGDGITGIVGTLTTYAGMLQFVPVADPGAATSTANAIIPIETTLDNMAAYQGQLVKVKNVTIAETGVFAASTNYTLSDGTNVGVMRTQYYDLPYLGADIPVGLQDITGVVLVYTTTAQLVPRSIDDFTPATVAAPTLTITELSVPVMTAEVGATDTETITVNGYNLTGDISLAVSGTDAALFTVSTPSITPVSGAVTAQTVVVTYTPTAAGSHEATLTLTSTGAEPVSRSLTGTATWAPLDAPVAAAASDVTVNGMTANWNAVSGATEYEVSVYTKGIASTTIVLEENFDGFIKGKANGGANSTDISASLDEYTQTKGWTGSKVYEAGSTAKMGGSSALGYIVTPTINLSANSGNFTVEFDAMAWSGDATEFNIYLDDVVVDTVTDLNNTDYSLSSFSINLSGGTSTSKLKFAAKQATKARFFLENIVITQNIQPISPISGSPFTVTGATSKVITGLNPDTEYFYTVVAKNTNVTSEASTEISARTSLITFSGSGDWNNPLLWNSGTVPTSTDNVVINGAVTISSDVAVGSVTNEMMNGTITVNHGKSLTINGDFINNNYLKILADAVNGSGTLITKGTVGGTGGSNIVQLYLTGSADNSARQWWYVSSPVASAFSGTFDPEGTNNIGYFDETLTIPAYDQITSNEVPLAVGKGYLLQNKASSTYTFSGGALNSGDITLNLTRTGTTAGQRGFNLVGNPYPSYLNWKAAYEAETTSNIRSTIWYRTSTGSGNGMQFLTYNAATDAGLGGVSNIVPPMQGFWMKVDADGAGGSITFTNDHRSHATSSNPMKAPAVDVKQKLRLKVNNGTVSDEMLLIGMSPATDGFEKFDSEKVANNSSDIPELFSFIGQQEIAINTVASLENRRFILGFRPGKESVFTITASEIANLDQQKVILKDHVLNTETELSAGTSYEFSSDATATNDRFSIEFRAPGMTTSVDTPEMQAEVFVNADNRIVVQAAGLTSNDRITVYNLAGQQLISQPADGQVTVIDRALNAGAYIVKVNSRVQKVVVN